MKDDERKVGVDGGVWQSMIKYEYEHEYEYEKV